MNKKPIDKSKKSNIKCEHCDWWCDAEEWLCFCELDTRRKANYWNKCEDFKWRTDREYKEQENGS